MEQSETTACGYCGCIHQTKCPMVKAIEYHQDGTVKRVEFYSASDYMQKAVVVPAHQPAITETTWGEHWGKNG